MSHTSIYVRDQEEAYDFYVNKLGFRVHTDMQYGEGERWLTVCPPQQPDLEITLMAIKPGQMWDEDTAAQVKALVAKGAFGAGVFRTEDCHATYEELKAKGVEFMREPQEQFYGTEALFRDPSGNWFSLSQPPKQ